MPTLTEITTRVADMLARTDLNNQIQAEIALACKRYSRKVTWLTELHDGTLATVVAQQWYQTFDLTAAEGMQDMTGRTAVPFSDVIRLQYLQNADYEFPTIRYTDFERLASGTGDGGYPVSYTLHAGRLGIWPTPSSVETLSVSAIVKPLVPEAGDDTSVWFTEAQEMIENAAAAAVCAKYIMDMDRAKVFNAIESGAYDDLSRESGLKMGTGRIKAWA